MSMRVRGVADDRGSLPLAMLAAIVIGAAVVALVASTIAGQRATRFDRSFTTVVQGADAGVQEAAHQILRGEPDEGPLEGSGALGATTFEWTATKESDVEWLIESTGTMDGVRRTVHAAVREQRRFQYAAFADTGLRFTGGNGADSYGDSGLENGIVATNETITLHGGSTGVDGVVLYNWDHYPDLNRCTHTGGSDCDDVKAMPEATGRSARIGPRLRVGDRLATAFIDEQLDACPAPLTSWKTSGATNTLGAPGTHSVLCFDNLTFDRQTTTTIEGTVEIYVAGTISIGNQANINCPGCGPGSTPDTTTLQIYSAGGSVLIGNHSVVAAAIYAPESACEGNPSNASAELYGSLICGMITNQGGWNFHYDDRLMSVGTGEWRVESWREEPNA